MEHSTDGVRVRVLGPAELVVDGKPVSLAGSPVLTRLLTLLALGPGKGVAAEVLRSEIWRDRHADKPAGSLQQAIRRLRAAGLRDHIPPEAAGRYRLDLSSDRVDVRRLIAAASALTSDTPPDDAELDEVLSLWRGDPTADPAIADGYGNQARQARRRLDAERRRRAKPRLLIIDDKVGHQIGSVLGDYRCTVLTRLDEF